MNNDNTMKLVQFDVGTFIELDDPLSGHRFVAMVGGTGTEFIDYISADAPAAPLPIFAALNPVELGDFRTLKHLVLENAPDQWEAFSAFVSDLLEKMPNYDDLRFMRGVKWAFDSGEYDLARAIEAADRDTAEARQRHAAITSRANALLSTSAL